MTILFLSIEFNYCCGISRSIFSLARELQQRGHRIVLGVPGGTMVADFVQSGMEYVFVPVRPQSKKITDLIRSVTVIRQALIRYSVDVVHSHHRLAEFYSLIATAFLNVPLVTTAHALISGKKQLSFRSDKIFAVSQAVVDMLTKEFAVAPQKIHLLRNIPRGLRIPEKHELAAVRTQLGLQENDYVVAGVGRLHPEKGFDVLLQAIKRISNLPLKTVLVGKGEELPVLDAYIRQYRLNVQIIDELSEVELVYALADVVVVPSRTESAGLVSIEAGMFARPLIASNVGGLKETIKDGSTGLLTAPENPAELSKAIEKLYCDRGLAEKLGRQLYQYVTDEYNAERIGNQAEHLYKTLLPGPH